MAYTNTWDETAPLGTAAANTIDDIIRQLKVDIRERMNSILDATGQWDDDPIVLNRPLRTGVEMILAPYSIVGERDDSDDQMEDQYYESDNSATNNARMTIPVEVGMKITKVEVLIDKNGETDVDLSVIKTTFAGSPSSTTVGTVNHSAAGIAIVTVVTGATETVDGDSYYWLKFVGNDAGRYRIYGARITYDEV